jgi:hypothetical protein
MQSAGKADRLLATIGASATAITAVLRGMLYIKDASWKEAGPGFRKACSESLAVDGALLESIWAIRIGKPKHDREATINLYMSVLDLIRDLSRQIDD